MPVQAGHHQVDVAHSEQLLHEIARRAGVPEPDLRLTRPKGPSVVPPDKKNERWSVELAFRDVSQPDEVLRGWFAHEVQHIRHADCIDGALAGVGRRDLFLAYLSLIGFFIVVGLGELLAETHRQQAVVVVGAGLLWLAAMVGIFLVLRRLNRLTRRRLDGMSQQLVELRNDLAAAQLTGPADVATALAELARRAKRPHIRAITRVNRLAVGASSHPSFTLRIAAVNSYDIDEDPLEAATRWLPR